MTTNSKPLQFFLIFFLNTYKLLQFSYQKQVENILKSKVLRIKYEVQLCIILSTGNFFAIKALHYYYYILEMLI